MARPVPAVSVVVAVAVVVVDAVSVVVDSFVFDVVFGCGDGEGGRSGG